MTNPPPRRVILLGASNLTLAFPLVVATLRAALGPVELLAAHGHGRSYGMTSRVLCRSLPGIRSCRLWDDLATRPRAAEPPLALVADVGNDLLYGASVEQVLRWVETALTRLREHHCRLTVGTLPLSSLDRLSRLRYTLTKSLFFPGQGPGWDEMRQLAPALDAGLRQLAATHGATTVTPRPEWYGFDPIHIRRRLRPAAWSEILSSWHAPFSESAIPTRPAPSGLSNSLRLWTLVPAQRSLCGRECEAPQPAATWEDGTTVSLY